MVPKERRSDESLRNQIRSTNQRAIETRQIAQRLGKLLPDRLRQVEARLRECHKASRAKRLALTSDEYLQHLAEYNDLKSEAMELRVRLDTLYLLMDARRSMNSFERHRLKTRISR